MSSPQDGPPAQAQSTLSFTQGFLLGQLSVVIFIGSFIKFFVFGEVPSPPSTASSGGLARKSQTQQHVRSTSLLSASPQRSGGRSQRSSSYVLRPTPRLTAATILSKTYYNVNSHQPESLDWFNVLIAQTIGQFRQDANDDDAILTSLSGMLNGPQKPDFLSEIKVTEISLGEEFPILSNCRVQPIEGDGDSDGDGDGPRLQARMDVDLNDLITLGVDTKLLLNYPRPLTAVLPVALAVSIVRFSGTLSISFLPSSTHPSPTHTEASQPQSQSQSQPPPPSTTPTSVAFSFLPDYRLDVRVRSLIGSRSRLQDIPKISQLVESRLHQWIDERCVEPRVQQVVLPSFWPRKKNMREPGSVDGTEGDGTARGGEGTPKASVVHAGVTGRRQSEGRSSGAGTFDQERTVFEEGLRLRRKEYDTPGSMPGMLVS